MNPISEPGSRTSTPSDEGTRRAGGDLDVDALVAYFARAGTVAPGTQDRITRLD